MHTIHLRERNVVTGLLKLQPNRLTRAVRSRPSVASIMPSCDVGRARVVSFIEAAYRKSYNASVKVDYPNLISVSHGDGRLVAAAGFRFADLSPLFLEQYTRRPIEEILGAPRRDIVEIGNLASQGGGSSVFLFAALASYLKRIEISRAVITSTDRLERRLFLLGLESQRICRARPECVAQPGEDWGSYYDHRPCVQAGRIDLAFDRLREIFGEGFFVRRPRLFPRLHCAVGPA